MKKTIQFIALTVFSFCCSAQPGTLDMSFNPDDIGYENGNFFACPGCYVQTTKLQNDGKIIMAGNYTGRYNGTPIKKISRLNSDGKLDASFLPSSINGLSYIRSIYIQNDGKILIGGRILINNETIYKYLARLNYDGSLDTSFNLNVQANGDINNIAIQSDGKIIVVGSFTSYNGLTINRVVRLNMDGTIDNTFNAGLGANGQVYTTAIQNDGKILIGGDFTSFNGATINRIARLNLDGSLDTAFNIGLGASANVSAISLQNDGKILIGGGFTTYNGTTINRIARLNLDGSLDTAFNIGLGARGNVSAISLQNDGKIIIGGTFTSYNGTTRYSIAKINSDGSIDSNFDAEEEVIGTVHSISIQSNDKIIVGGTIGVNFPYEKKVITRLNNDGTLDNTFNTSTGASMRVNSSAIQTNGKVLIGGDFRFYNNKLCGGLVRINNDGAIDNTFNYQTNGGESFIKSMAIQNDGKILIGGYLGVRMGIARLNSNGTIDNTFNINGSGLYYISSSSPCIYDIAIQNDGKIIVVGQFHSYNGIPCNNIVRLNSDGTFDYSFNVDTNITSDYSIILTTVIQTDGKIIIGGFFGSYNGISCVNIARLNSDGTFDYSFISGTDADGSITTLEIQSDNKILVGGSFTYYNGISAKSIVRINSNGTLDLSFNNNGSGIDGFINSIKLQNDGKIIIGGEFNSYNGFSINNLARINSNGSIDTSLNPGTGPFSRVNDILIINDGKILIGGDFTSYNGIGRNRIARINGDNALEASIFEKNSIVIYPNPVNNFLQIQTPNNTTIASSKILDISGKVIIEQKTNSNTVNTETLSKGFYILEVISGKDKFVSKFIKE